jgi:hypothetical protein
MKNEVTAAKELGWTHISITAKEFKGAVQNFNAADGKTVALCFGMHDAFIVEDDAGLFNASELFNGVVKEKSIDVEACGEIAGALSLAYEVDGIVNFDDERLEKYGLNDFSVKESIENRLRVLAALDVLVDMPLS